MLACKSCGVFEPEELYFSVEDGGFLCSDCFDDNGGKWTKLRLPELSAIRHIVLADFDRLFNFRVSERAGDKLATFTEDYLLTHLERNFKTLDFYHGLF